MIDKVRRIRKKHQNKILLFFILAIVYIFFYFFLWHGKLLFTPDFGQADAYNINLSYKYFLAKNLKNNKIPLWTNKIHNGLPVVGESQAGVFYLPNLILYKFLPFSIAHNLNFILHISLSSVGVYILLRFLKVNKPLAFLISLNLPLILPFSLRWVHLNSIQAYYLLPLLIFFLLKSAFENSKTAYFAAPFLIQQIIFAGHIASSYITVFSSIFLVSTIIIFQKTKMKTKIFSLLKICIILIFGLIFAAPHLIESSIFGQYTKKFRNIDYDYAVSFSYNPKNIKEFFYPFANGDPRNGTYPRFSRTWGTFWENGTYPGAILVLLSFISLILIFYDRSLRKNKVVLSLFAGFVFFFLLALGSFSPIYFLFNFPPFVFFRTPSRYLVPAIFFLIIMTSFVLSKKIKGKTKIAIYLLLILNLTELLFFIKNYHLFVKENKLLSAPKILKFFSPNEKYISVGTEDEWNKIFLSLGWSRPEYVQGYLFLRNYFYPNSGLIFNLRTSSLNSGGFKSPRTELLQSLIESSVYQKNCDLIDKFLTLANVSKLIANSKLSCKNLKLIAAEDFANPKLKLYLYSTAYSQDSIITPENIKNILFLEDFLKTVNTYSLQQIKNTAFVESEETPFTTSNLKILKQTVKDDEIRIQVDKNTQGYILIDQMLFPNWQASIDGKRAKLYKANLTQTLIFVPKGSQEIKLAYTAAGIEKGIQTALISLPFYFLFIYIATAKKPLKVFFQFFQQILQ